MLRRMVDDVFPTADNRPFVMIVDDDPNIRRLVMFILQDRYYVLEAGAANEATRWLDLSTLGGRKSRIRAVLLDVMMPGLDGFHLCRLIKREYNVPIIMLTGLSAMRDVQEAMESGADDFLAKPCSPGTLIQKVDRWTRR